MKLCLLFICVFTLTLSASSFAQQERVSFDLKNVSVKVLLDEIQKQTSWCFLFNPEQTKQLGKLSLRVENETVEEVLNRILKDTDLTFKFKNDLIMIVPKEEVKDDDKKKKDIQIVGLVTDNNKLPLPGVTVIVKGLTIGTATDASGKYTLSLPKTEKFSLLFSFIGMKTKEVVYTGKDTINVVMQEDVETLDDVIVTGYATIDRGSYVGAVTQIRAEDIQVAGEATIDQMLQGVIPGMSVVNRTGKVGGSPKIRIRGTSTLLGNQEPLWVVDGVIQTDPLPLPDDASPISSEMDGLRETASNAISWLNPADIETITVLKDASATAIYGTRATNGVIVITTKKAKGDGLNISYSGNFSVGMKPGYRMYDMMNSQEHMRFSRELWEDRDSYNQNIQPIGYAGLIQKLQKKEITQQQFEQEYRKMENMNTDWFDILFRNSFSHVHNISISAQGEKVSSRFSIGINSTKGEAKGNDMLTLTANSNTTFRLDERLIIDLQLNGTYRETKDFAFGVSPYEYALNTARDIPAYNEDGSLYYYEKAGATSYSIPDKVAYNYNILNERDNSGTETDGTNLQAALNLRWNLLKDLEFQTTASYAIATNKIKSWATEYTHYIAQIRGYEVGEILPNSAEQYASILPFGGLLQSEYAQTKNYSFRSSLVYNKLFNEDHRLTLNLGFQGNSVKQDGNANLRYGYLYYREKSLPRFPRK
ncbi:MAG: SusC/RagA family TonB-linked outer membrane protein [Butyricimonas faecihominis]